MKKEKLPILFRITVMLVALVASNASFAAVIPNSVSAYVTRAQNLGPEDPSKVIEISVDLAVRDPVGRDALLKELYDPNSPLYQKWLTPEEYAARFGPTAQQATMVQDFLTAHGLTVISVSKFNNIINAQGTIADIQKAFTIQINRFQINGDTRYATLNNPSIPAQLVGTIASIGGLSQVLMKPHHVFPVDPDTGKQFKGMLLQEQPSTMQPLAATGAQLYYEYVCYRGVETHTFAPRNGGLPSATYTGNRYGADIHNGQGHLPPCGYEPTSLQTAYGLKALYNAGLDGIGQSVVIVDAYGSPTAAADLQKFSTTFGLPLANFSVRNPRGSPPYSYDWAAETTLDIEWAHAIAPGANIVLIQAINNSDMNLRAAIQYALDNRLGNVISNSYGSIESEVLPAEETAWDNVVANAAALGVSANFSTGDTGDYSRDRSAGGITVSVPANSPHATAVGGISAFLNADYSIKFQTGWGTTLTAVGWPQNYGAVVPPYCMSTGKPPGKCFYLGGGGGMSKVFAKPSFQNKLPGTGRQLPDVSWVADGYTPVTIVYSFNKPGTYSVTTVGGTSVACPMFSALWAIVNQKNQQKNGHSAGLAAPYMYSLPASAVYDIVQASPVSGNNLQGNIFTGGPPQYWSPSKLVGPDVPQSFTSMLFQSEFTTRWMAIGFGLDASLTTHSGWDNVTGVGVPKGANFVNAIVP